ncbi:MAG: polysaccharide deacetylase family protein [Eubacterium sp.]|jgi:peptidoglycan/xylan/chitin deacetylase (PgdA/CDA1 family)
MSTFIISITMTTAVLAVYSIIPTAILRAANMAANASLRKDKVICLTFDDGPSPEYTPALLALLAKYNIKATFFVMAGAVRENPYLLDAIRKAGHSVALHTMDHKCPLFTGARKTEEDFRNSMEIMDGMGTEIRYFRPAWGTFNLKMLAEIRRRGLKTVLWNVMVGDWEGRTTAETLEKRLYSRVGDSSLICLHDGRGKNDAPARTIAALDRMIPVWKREGYSFLTIEEYYGTIRSKKENAA